jgi:chromosome segregation ATPase
VEPPAAPAPNVIEAETSARRASLKRRAAGLSAIPEPAAPAAAAPAFDEFDGIDSVAELAAELERALTEAAEANENLRKDLGTALDDLARSTAESKRLAEKVDRLELDSRDRAKVVQDLVRELELLEGERDGALSQASDAALETEELDERLQLTERRVHDLERTVADGQARVKRFEEAAATHAAQRAAMRTELEALRRERDGLLTKNAELEREREDLGRSRKALDEVHRALSDARQRAQRIRPR